MPIIVNAGKYLQVVNIHIFVYMMGHDLLLIWSPGIPRVDK